MGLIKNAKASGAANDAGRAASEGHKVFLYCYNLPNRLLSGPVPGAAEVIEAIERHGWSLTQVAFDEKHGPQGAVLLLFRR